jgi:hypothetical protein
VGRHSTRIRAVGLAALMAVSLMGDGIAQTLLDEIQDDEAPGSEIEMDIGRGRVEIGREKFMHPSPIEIEGETMQVPDDPDTPEAARDRKISPARMTTTHCRTDRASR